MGFNVIEKFLSIDGEGPTAGELAAFIRFGGCNLACSWCDTAYSMDSSELGELLSMEQIYDYIKNTGARNVTLTGGEPMLQKDFGDLLKFLSEDTALMIHVETNGSIPIYEYGSLSERENISFVVDYKLPSSGMESQMNMLNYKSLCGKDVCKFVIASQQDLVKAKEIIDCYNLMDKCQVYLSPIPSSIEPAILVEFMKCHNLYKARLQLQLHKIIWSPETRCV